MFKTDTKRYLLSYLKGWVCFDDGTIMRLLWVQRQTVHTSHTCLHICLCPVICSPVSKMRSVVQIRCVCGASVQSMPPKELREPSVRIRVTAGWTSAVHFSEVSSHTLKSRASQCSSQLHWHVSCRCPFLYKKCSHFIITMWLLSLDLTMTKCKCTKRWPFLYDCWSVKLCEWCKHWTKFYENEVKVISV